MSSELSPAGLGRPGRPSERGDGTLRLWPRDPPGRRGSLGPEPAAWVHHKANDCPGRFCWSCRHPTCPADSSAKRAGWLPGVVIPPRHLGDHSPRCRKEHRPRTVRIGQAPTPAEAVNGPRPASRKCVTRRRPRRSLIGRGAENGPEPVREDGDRRCDPRGGRDDNDQEHGSPGFKASDSPGLHGVSPRGPQGGRGLAIDRRTFLGCVVGRHLVAA